jgi:hypothetical protein
VRLFLLQHWTHLFKLPQESPSFLCFAVIHTHESIS